MNEETVPLKKPEEKTCMNEEIVPLKKPEKNMHERGDRAIKETSIIVHTFYT